MKIHVPEELEPLSRKPVRLRPDKRLFLERLRRTKAACENHEDLTLDRQNLQKTRMRQVTCRRAHLIRHGDAQLAFYRLA